MKNNVFIVFEGGEGSGKSTQAKVLANRLRRLGFGIVLTHEPGGTLLGNKLRRWLKWGRGVTTQSELFLFLASRSQLVSKVICPALDRGQIVICDRFDASTFAYQGYGRGMRAAVLAFAFDGLGSPSPKRSSRAPRTRITAGKWTTAIAPSTAGTATTRARTRSRASGTTRCSPPGSWSRS